jgi:asparagine synthase (glutamine-hydrolysing)
MTEILVRTVRGRAASDGDPRATRGRYVFSDGFLEILVDGDAVDRDFHADNGKLCALCGDVATETSAESMLDSYQRHGAPGVAETEGHFVAVFYDSSTGVVSIVHDKAGLRHAYYWSRGKEFALSTDLFWLLEDSAREGTLRPATSPRGVALYVTFQYVPAPYTIIEDVLQLPPGAELHARRGREAAVRSLVEFPTPGLPSAQGSLEEHAERIGGILATALADQLEGEDRIGAMLSGGMDTSTNVALMVERLGVRPTTFTASFRDQRYDEKPFANIVADHYGLEQASVRIGAEMIEELPEVVKAFDGPNADQAIFAQYFVCRQAADLGCRRVVTGEGGDEVLGYPQYHDEEVLGRPLREADTLNYRSLPDDPATLARTYLERTFLAPKEVRDRLLVRLEIEPEEPYCRLEEIYRAYPNRDPFERLLFGQWRTWLRDGVYVKDSRLLKHFGIVPVLPFMSTRLMEYVADLPLEYKFAGMDDKRFLRVLLADSLPKEIFGKEKHKFFLPWPRWSREDAKDFLRDNLLASDGLVVKQFGEGVVRELLDENERAANHSRLLWGLLFLKLWYEERVDRYIRAVQSAAPMGSRIGSRRDRG